MVKITQVKKRDGRIVDFKPEKIEKAIKKALIASKQGNGEISKELTKEVIDLLQKRFENKIPSVEDIQDIVEEVLILADYPKAAKAYILYREQHRRIREIKKSNEEAVEMVDQYLQESDWEVRENSNMAYSLQGLNNYVTSAVIKRYWLNKIYPPEIRKSNESGDFHIHDLQVLGPYCVGWDLYDLLLRGFGGVFGKIESKPPKHLSAALGQIVNFFYTLQGEAAGAVALSSFDTLLSPFIYYDQLSYPQVKQEIQEFLFNCNVPTRVGFQCVSEDTEILTPEGWKNYEEIQIGDTIKTFNLKSNQIENQKVTSVFKKHYKGTMYRLQNRIQDQLISPKHRVVRKKFQQGGYILEPIEEVCKLKSPFIIPIVGKNNNKEADISDEQIKLMAWIISEGTIEKPTKNRCCYRVSIYQSKEKNRENYNEIIKLLRHFNLNYSEYQTSALGDNVCRIRLDAESSKKIHQWFGTKENVHFIPASLLNLNEKQSKLFLETYLKADGFEGCKISTTDLELLDGLQIIIVNCGYGFTVLKRKPTIGKKDIYVLRIIKHQETYIQKVEKVNYKGIIWCPHTKNETIIARRKGKVFITGNTPFTNLTLDLKVPEHYKSQPVLVGGKFQDKTYGEFQEEVNMINRALAEVMIEGDAKGRPFTFPIPTYNITRDFDWKNSAYEPIWKMTAKYGIPYFANFINSDMKPEDVRSMCLAGEEEILIRNSKKIKRASIQEIAQNYKKDEFDEEGWAECKKEGGLEVLSLNPENLKLEWSPVKRFLKIVDRTGIEIISEDGKKTLFSLNHPVAIYTPQGIRMKWAKEVQKGDCLLTLKEANEEVFSKEYQKFEDFILDEDLAKILGYFVADGNYLFESRKGYAHFGEPRGLQFTFKTGDHKNLGLIKSLIKKVFGVEGKEKQDPRYNTYYLYIYNTEIARKLYTAGFRKYGRLPQVLFNSPKSVINSFLNFHFKGDGYEKRKEIHLNDLELSRDLVLLYSLIGQPVTYRLRKRSQVIYLQHLNSPFKKNNNWLNNPILAERTPAWTTNGKKIPGFYKSRMIGFDTIEKHGAQTVESSKIKNSDIYIVRVKSIKKKTFKELKEFYDLELEKNHLFIHSLGQISFNCCRLRLSNKELYKRGGGLFGSNPLTGSLGVVTINLPRVAYLSKTQKEFFEKLSEVMDLAKDSLEIKRKTLENLTEKGLYPYSRHYLDSIKKMRGKYWANHFSTIGLVGMNEALLNFKQTKTNIGTKTGQEFAQKVLDFMRDRIVMYQEEDGGLYNLEATPAEGSLDPKEKILISQSDPKLTEIGPLIDKYLEKNKENIQFIGNSEVLKIPEGEMFTYGFNRKNQKIKKYPVTALVRHLAHSMYEINTISGRKVKVTGQHSVFTLNSKGETEEVLVRNLKEKDLIAIPKKIEMEEVNQELNLIDIFKKASFKDKLYLVFPLNFIEKLILNPAVKEWVLEYYNLQWKDVKYFWKKNRVVPLSLIYDLGFNIKREVLESSKIFYRDTKNTKPINVLISLNRAFGFVLGCLLAEGWVSERSEFINTDKNLVQRFVLGAEEVFGKGSVGFSSFKREKDKRKTRYTAVLSKIIGCLFEAIDFQGKSNTKKIPAFIFFSSKDCVAGVLEGFHLGDGYIYQNRKKNDYSVRLYTNSKELIEGLNLCLLKLGILAKIRQDKKSKYNSSWKDNYILSITGADNLKKYLDLVLRKKLTLENLHSSRETIFEAPKLIKSVMEKHSLNPSQVGFSKDSFNRNLRNNKISLQYLKKITDKLSTLVNDKVVSQLQVLINSNLYWDKIVKIRKIDTPQYVYDLEVDVPGDQVNNFLGGEGLVCLHNTSYRLALKDKQRYPDIITAGTEEKPYYTNSSQLPVNFTDDLFEALKLQDNLQTKYTGGTSFHAFLGEQISDFDQVPRMIKRVFENFRLPYFTLTPTFSICPVHGYISGEHFICPKCVIEQPCEVYSRIVGYLRPVQQWNEGKKQEFKERKEFKM